MRYSLSEFISTTYSWILTKVFFPKARLVRRPVYIRGGQISYGEGFTTGYSCRFDLPGNGKKTLLIGKNCRMNDNCHFVAYNRVVLGDNVLIASKVFISDTNHGCYTGDNQDVPNSTPNDRPLVSGETVVGNNVWIGENVVILAGAKIGDGCIIGANAVVTGVIPDNSIAVGAPAKVIKVWDEVEKKWVRA